MVSVYLYGRLGNMMFEIACAIGLALDNDDDYAFDFINGWLTKSDGDYNENPVFNKLTRLNIKFSKAIRYFEPAFTYNKIPYIKHPDYVYMIAGYFQSEKYFINHRDTIKKLFTDTEIKSNLYNKYRVILDKSVSLNVRRTDYVKLANINYLQPTEYYINAINYIDNLKQIKNILVFSDDIEWCKQNLSDDRMSFMEGLKDYEGLYLASLCDDNIVVNSSFSWWSAYLNNNPGKIVIMPKIWLGKDANRDWRDIYPEGVTIL